MDILENYSLKELNSFSISANSRYFVVLDKVEEIQEFLEMDQYRGLSRLVLGGGSNILLSGNFDGITVKVDVTGKELRRMTITFMSKQVRGRAGTSLSCTALRMDIRVSKTYRSFRAT